MTKHYDVCVIGLGPAGMAVSVMASHMGLRVLGIEQRALGGECMSFGCIPSKALLRAAAVRHGQGRLALYGLEPGPAPRVEDPLQLVRRHVQFIRDKKTQSLFDRVDLKLGEGAASFVDDRTVAVGGTVYTAKRIFVCVGSRPAVPAIPGIRDVPYLTNETLFSLEQIPESLVIIGGGAIGCEMAQAFARLGARTSIVHMDAHLLPHGDSDAGKLLEDVFREEGIEIHNHRALRSVAGDERRIIVRTDHGETLVGEKLLVAAGRQPNLSSLALERAGIDHNKAGILVDPRLRTNRRRIYAAGDCIGWQLFSHAAMHQGMLALLNAILPRPLARNARRYVVPWAVFTDPPVAHVGRLERDLQATGVDYEVIEERYEDYGAAIAEGVAVGSVRAYVSPTGRIYGVRIIGEGAPEMINEWGLAVQERLRMHRVLFLQHAFPSMSFLNKRVSEGWMMRRMAHPALRRIVRWLF